MTGQKIIKPAPTGLAKPTAHQAAKEAFENRVAEGDGNESLSEKRREDDRRQI